MDVKLPHLGEGADSGTVVNLFVKEGDAIEKDQPILELENEKAVATIPSSAGGTVSKVFVKVGDKISVGQRIVSLTGGSSSTKPAQAPRPQAKAAPPEPEEESEGPSEEPEESLESQETTDAAQSIAAAPTIRRLAHDLGIDLTRVRG